MAVADYGGKAAGKNMRNIGIFAFVEKNQGGVYQYTVSYVQALSTTNKNNYTVFTYMRNNDFDNLGFKVVKLKKNILEKMAGPFSLIFRSINPLLLLYSHLFKEIDIIVSPVLCNYLYVTNKRFIFTLHDLQEKYYPEFFTFKQRVGRQIRNLVLTKRASRILCESNYVKNDIVKYLAVNPDKITVIQAPAAVEFNKNDYSPDELKKIRLKYKLPDNYIFYPAQFWPHKNHERLLDAFKTIVNRIDNIHLVLSGTKQNNFSQVVAKIKDLFLDDKVHYAGYIDAIDVASVYKMSKMLVMPSLYESISIPVYEAFSIGTPVCSSNVFALAEQVGDAGLLFDPNNARDIADKVLRLLIDDELRQKLVQRGYEKIKAMSFENYSKKLVGIIDAELKIIRS